MVLSSNKRLVQIFLPPLSLPPLSQQIHLSSMASSSAFKTSNLNTSPITPALPFGSSPSLFFRLHNYIPTASLRAPAPLQISCSLSDAASSPAASQLPPLRRRIFRPDYIPNRISDPNYVRIFDTTLRDGEQAPGAALMLNEKIDIARQLARLGVDIIEAGFPAASEEEFKAVKEIAQTVGNEVDPETGYVPVICGASRCNEKDIQIAWDAVKYAKRPRIHSFISTSDIHLKYKLRKSREEVLEIATRTTRYARSLGCDDVQIGLEDAARADREFLYLFTSEVIKAGATTVSLGDTVGIQLPDELAQLVADLKANTPGIENVIVACHCHNDLGFATANTVAGGCAGARQLEMTINGIGERAGNASFEEVVMSMKCRGEELLGGLYTGIETRHISKTSKMVEEYTGLRLQPHKAIVGANVFVHGSGIHQDGILKHKSTYEILRAEDIGTELTEENAIFLGKLSGRNGLKDRLRKLGYEYEGEQLNSIFSRFKAVAAHKKQVTDADLISLVSDGTSKSDVVWKLHDLQVTSGTIGVSKAKVKLINAAGEEKSASATGNGPLETAFKAVDIIVKEPATLLEYSIDAVTEGIDSIVSTRVLIRGDDYSVSNSLSGEMAQTTFSGTGAGMDIIVSSVKAYIDALNKMSGSKQVLQVKVPAIAETAGLSV